MRKAENVRFNMQERPVQRKIFTLIELLVKITCFSGDLAKAHEV